MYQLTCTELEEVLGTFTTEAEAYAATGLSPSDCVDGAETWEEVIAASEHHEHGSTGVLVCYRVERMGEAVRVRKGEGKTKRRKTTKRPRKSPDVSQNTAAPSSEEEVRGKMRTALSGGSSSQDEIAQVDGFIDALLKWSRENPPVKGWKPLPRAKRKRNRW